MIIARVGVDGDRKVVRASSTAGHLEADECYNRLIFVGRKIDAIAVAFSHDRHQPLTQPTCFAFGLNVATLDS